jgi:hypothetical protein
MVAAFLIAGTLAATPAFSEPYLVDVLAKPTYGKSWNALFFGEKNVETWLTEYSRTLDGPATPGKIITLDETHYQINDVCKTHSCGSNTFYVLFAPNGAAAWGLLLTEDRDGRKKERFFGNPDAQKKQALRAAAN